MLVYLMSLSYPDMLVELSRREKEANIKPDADIDVYMKVKSFTWKNWREHNGAESIFYATIALVKQHNDIEWEEKK